MKRKTAKAKNGDTVRVRYTGKFDDGTVFDCSTDRAPLKFVLGMGQVISGFEEAVIGMRAGESKTVKIPADKAYGPRREEMVVSVKRKQFPTYIKPQVGQLLEVRESDRRGILVKVTGVSESDVTLDANHPLAGFDLTFEIELMEIC